MESEAGGSWGSIPAYSQGNYARSKLSSNKSKDYWKNPKLLMKDALQLTKNIGTSTCVVLALDPDKPVMRSSLIGDSGYLIYRNLEGGFKLIYESPDHQRSFNFPYQIGTNGDNPEIALEKTHEVLNGEVVILGTDGVLDNLDVEDITTIVNKQGNRVFSDTKELAQEIAEVAFGNSFNRKKASPFEKKARNSGLIFPGGKPDDITVVVAVINLKAK